MIAAALAFPLVGIYEAAAILTGRVPTITTLARRHRLLAGVGLAWLSGHLLGVLP
jgi:hypothetical protein